MSVHNPKLKSNSIITKMKSNDITTRMKQNPNNNNYTKKSLGDLKVTDLRKIASNLKIKNLKKLNKNDLITTIIRVDKKNKADKPIENKAEFSQNKSDIIESLKEYETSNDKKPIVKHLYELFNAATKQKINRDDKTELEIPKIDISNVTITDDVSHMYTGSVFIKTLLKYSEAVVKRHFWFKVNNKSYDDIKNDAYTKTFTRYYGARIHKINIFIGSERILSFKSLKNDAVKYTSMPIKEVAYRKLPYDINSNNAIVETSCVKEYFLTVATKLNKVRSIKNMDEDNWTVEKLTMFLNNNRINYTLLDRSLNKRYNETFNKKMKLFFICANEHIYPLTKQEYIMCKTKKYDILINEVKQTKFTKVSQLYNTLDAIKHVNFKQIRDQVYLKSFVTDSTLYLSEDEYKYYDLYQKIGLNVDMIVDVKFSLTSPLFKLAQKFNLLSDPLSFFNTPKPVFINIPTNQKNLYTLDENASYATSLINLEYIPVIRLNNHVMKYDNEQPIIDTNFYYVSSVNEIYTSYIRQNEWTSGYRINIFGKDAVTIEYYIEPELVENPYKNIFKDLYEENKALAKNILCIFVGMMQRYINDEVTEVVYFKDMIYNEYELDTYDNYIQIKDNMYMAIGSPKYTTKYNKSLLPCAHYIIDKAISRLFNKINETIKKNPDLKIHQIKTDSITFSNLITEPIIETNKVGGWKKERPKLRDTLIFMFQDNNEKRKRLHNKNEFYVNKNTLSLNMAGCGKTHFIINTLLKKITGNYVILTAQHRHYIPYKQLGLEAYTIDSFIENNKKTLKKYKNIIIDECGLLNTKHWNYIIVNHRYDQYIYAFGDKYQLLPVNENLTPLFNKQILNIFDYNYKMTINYRNKYSKDDYADMIEGFYELTENELDSYIYRESNEDTLTICYFNKTADLVNESITKNWTDTFCGLKVKNGAKLICKSNSLILSHNICNNMDFTVINYDNKNITLNNNNISYTLSLSSFKLGNFTHFYACTLYKSQGMTIPKDNLRIRDIDHIQTVKGGLYTALSRAKF